MRYIPMIEGFDAGDGLTLEDLAALATGRPRLRGVALDAARPRRRWRSWAYAIRAGDRERLEPHLEPLAKLRSPTGPVAPIVVADELDLGDQRQRADWVDRFAYSADLPDQLLLVGGPERFPFLLQAELAIVTKVGRVAFDVGDHPDDHLTAYVDKLCRWSRDRRALPPARRAVFFATSAPADPQDATNFSRWMLAAPLARHCERPEITVTRLFDEQATIPSLLEELTRPGVGLALPATHGRVRPLLAGSERQRQENGALVDAARPQRQLRGQDLPDGGTPICEGGVFFQFACCGYGTPRTSRFAHWWPDPERISVAAEHDFVAALPQRLLAHPRGPAAFIGHVDVAWAQSFADEDELQAGRVADHHRLRPFRDTTADLVRGVPAGAAMARFTGTYNLCNQRLTSLQDEAAAQGREPTAEEQASLVSWFMLRNDLENHFLFGDPAAAVPLA